MVPSHVLPQLRAIANVLQQQLEVGRMVYLRIGSKQVQLEQFVMTGFIGFDVTLRRAGKETELLNSDMVTATRK